MSPQTKLTVEVMCDGFAIVIDGKTRHVFDQEGDDMGERLVALLHELGYNNVLIDNCY